MYLAMFCTAKHGGTSHTSAYQCPMSQHGSIFDHPLLGVSWWSRDAGSENSVHWPSLWPARRFGTLADSLRDPDLGGENFRRFL